MAAFSATMPKARAPAACRPRMVKAQASRRQLAATIFGGVAATTLVGQKAEAASFSAGLFPALRDNKSGGGKGVSADPGSSKNAPGGAKDPAQKDTVDKAAEKYSAGATPDPSPKFKSDTSKGDLSKSGGEFKNLKPDDR